MRSNDGTIEQGEQRIVPFGPRSEENVATGRRTDDDPTVLPVPGPFVAVLFRAVPGLALGRLFAGVLLQRGNVLEAAVARVTVRELSRYLSGGRAQGTVLAVLAGGHHRMILPGGLLVTVPGPGVRRGRRRRPVRVNEAAIVLTTAVPDLRLRLAVPFNWKTSFTKWQNPRPRANGPIVPNTPRVALLPPIIAIHSRRSTVKRVP